MHGSQWVAVGRTGSQRVAPDRTELRWVKLGCARSHWIAALGLTRSNRVALCRTGSYLVLLGCTGLYWIELGCPGLHWFALVRTV